MENRKTMLFGSLLLGGVLVFSLYGIGSSVASGGYEREHEEEEYEHEYENKKYSRLRASKDHIKMNPTTAQYVEECGSCHMAYQAQLLPAASWHKMMLGLEDHFGENAELDDETRQAIESYLVNAANVEKGGYRKMLRNLNTRAPLRITELPYFQHEHDEIPSRFVKGNDKVASLSQCNACHKGAEKGWFDEDDVVIPGVGRWDD